MQSDDMDALKSGPQVYSEPKNVLSRQTLVPLGLVCVVAFSIASGAIWISSQLKTIDYSIKDLRISLTRLESSIDDIATDTWTKSDMTTYIELLRAKNPNLDLPLISH